MATYSTDQSSLEISVIERWGGGLVANLSVSTEAPLNGWTASFAFAGDITNIWNAQILSQTGDIYTVGDVGYNAKIAAGQSATFGFQGDNGSEDIIGVAINGVSVDNDAVALPSVSIADAEGFEEDGEIVFRLSLSEPIAVEATVDYRTIAETAGADDFTPAVSQVVLPAGSVSTDIRVSLIDDDAPEPTESFKLELTGATGAIIADGFATGLVSDDDPENDDGDDNPTDDVGGGIGDVDGPFSPNDYAEALSKSMQFYYAQYSGDLPDEHPITWRGDSALDDGSDVGRDLAGGWYDAGDHVKFGFPMAYTATTLAWGGLAFGEGYQAAGAREDLLAHIRWVNDYFLKAYDDKGTPTLSDDVFYAQVGDGDIDHAYWGSPESMTMERPSYFVTADAPGSEVTAETAAAMAAASLLLAEAGDTAYADKLLDNAKKLFAFAETYQGTYTDAVPDARSFYNSFSGYLDELSWAANWLYQATGDRAYLTKSESYYSPAEAGWAFAWDDKGHGTALLLARQTGDARYRADLEDHFAHWLDQTQRTPGTETNDGLAWLDQWGANRYATNTAFLAALYAEGLAANDPNGDAEMAARLKSFLADQIDYVLGDNPDGRSYVVGFGNDYPLNPHHRAASGTSLHDPAPNRHVLNGALVGGPTAQGFYDDRRDDYIKNEVATDYNAGFSGALAALLQMSNDGDDGSNGGEQIEIAVSDAAADEVADVISFSVTLSAATTDDVEVSYRTVGGSAAPGDDYAPASSALVIPAGEIEGVIEIDLIDDDVAEDVESFQIELTGTSAGAIADRFGIGRISDNDPAVDDPLEAPPGDYIDITEFGAFYGTSSNTRPEDLVGGRTAITTEALVAYNGLRNFLELQASDLETIGAWAFANHMTNNATPYGQDLSGVGLYYAMQGAKVGWIRDDAFAPQLIADTQRQARLGDPNAVMDLVAANDHPGFAERIEAEGLTPAFVNTLKMEPHYGGWMHGRTHGHLGIKDENGTAVAMAHDVNHLTVLNFAQDEPFMNDTFLWPQWSALDVPHRDVIDYFQSMVTLGDPNGDALPSGAGGAPAAPPELDVIGEARTLSVSQASADQWHAVTFAQPLDDPSVVLGPPSSNGGQPTTVRVRDVSTTGFEFQIDEWDYLDGLHIAETLSWLAVEAGTHVLSNGVTLRAGSATGGATPTSVAFGEDFGATPVVLGQAVTANGAAAVATRLDAITSESFEFRFQTQEADNHAPASEAFDWIAVDAARQEGFFVDLAGEGVTQSGTAISFAGSFEGIGDAPALFAAMQTFNGSDPATVRARRLSTAETELFIEEERSADSEVSHVAEVVGVLGVEEGLLFA